MNRQRKANKNLEKCGSNKIESIIQTKTNQVKMEGQAKKTTLARPATASHPPTTSKWQADELAAEQEVIVDDK